MSKPFKIVISVLVIVILGLATFWFFAGEIYLWTENRNFEKLREKSTLHCDTMPYHCAVRDHDFVQIQVLRDDGVALESKDSWGRSVLFWLAWNSPESMDEIESLLKLGLDPNTTSESGETIFHYSTQIGITDEFVLATLLLEYGAHIDDLTTSGYGTDFSTSLHSCVMDNNVACTKFLLEHEARTDVEDSYGYTVIERLEMHTHINNEVKQLLMNQSKQQQSSSKEKGNGDKKA